MIYVCFYCFAVNDWKERLTNQIRRMKNSGLYDAAKSIHLYISGEQPISDVIENPNEGPQKEEAEKILLDFPKIELNYTAYNYQEGFLALSKIHQLSQEDPNGKFLYFHTKGVFNKYKNFETKEIDESKIESLNSWVEMLEYFTIDRWQDCVDKLSEHELTGMISYHGWWWGNFWWAASSYISNCVDYGDGGGRDRWCSEAWLHETNENRDNVKRFEFYPVLIDYGFCKIPKYFYNNSVNKDDVQINILKAEYGYFGVQRDEGRLPPVEAVLFDVTDKVKEMMERDEIQPNALFDHDIAPHLNKCQHPVELKITFTTNIDPENIYYISSYANNSIRLREMII